jgi:uncharacterized protein (TIGR03118 family)
MKILYVVTFSFLVNVCSLAQSNNYTVTPIVNNTQDVYLVNPWGLSRPASATPHDNEWWVSDDATGYTTLYFADKTGGASLAGLVISVPSASGKGTGTPTGTAFSAAKGPGPGSDNFAFATLDGTISNWNAGQTPTTKGAGCYACHVSTTTVYVNNSSKKAVYTGLAEATNAADKKPTYYAANNNGGVEAYDATTFKRVTLTGTFSDPKIPASYKAYGIQTIGSQIWVTYFNGTSGGYVDAFDTNGKLQLSLASGDVDEPWGVALAPANFGAFSGDLLVGNTTSGMIAAFSPTTGAFKGYLNDAGGSPIVIQGLWGIGFGNGNPYSGPTNTLYYAAGGNFYTTGVFGAITAEN